MPLLPVGKQAAVQSNSRSLVSGLCSAACVEHHLDDTFNIAINRRQGADIEPKTTGDRGRALFLVNASPSISLDLSTSSVRV